MALDHWLAFLAATAVLLTTPGTTTLLLISYSLGHGRRLAPAIITGVALGDFSAMTASMAGLGAILLASARIFMVLKWIGATYLIYLGLKLWHAPVFAGEAGAAGEIRPRRAFTHAYAVTALNPKGILFFVAFVPQFIVPSAPLLPQIVVLEATFLVLATFVSAAYSAAAIKARQTIRHARIQRLVNRASGLMLIGAGLLAAAWGRVQA